MDRRKGLWPERGAVGTGGGGKGGEQRGAGSVSVTQSRPDIIVCGHQPVRFSHILLPQDGAYQDQEH